MDKRLDGKFELLSIFVTLSLRKGIVESIYNDSTITKLVGNKLNKLRSYALGCSLCSAVI